MKPALLSPSELSELFIEPLFRIRDLLTLSFKPLLVSFDLDRKLFDHLTNFVWLRSSVALGRSNHVLRSQNAFEIFFGKARRFLRDVVLYSYLLVNLLKCREGNLTGA